MSYVLRTSASIIALLTLTACGGSSGGGVAGISNPMNGDEVQERVTRQELMEDRVMALPGTAFDQVPNKGSAEFRGMGRVEMGFDGARDDLALVGFAVLTADFSDDTLTGTVTNIEGHTGNRPRDNNVFDVDGTIFVGDNPGGGNLSSDINDKTNQWSSEYRGRLQSDLGRINLDGELEGRFRGTRPGATGGLSTIKTIGGSSTNGVATLDGDRADDMLFEVYGLND